jgi:hypothetical protein
MQFATGSATDPVDLLQQLESWLSGLGWTIDRNASEGAGWTVTAHNNGNYVHLRAGMNEGSAVWQSTFGNAYTLGLIVGTGFISGQPFNAQTTGAPLGSGGAYPIGTGMRLSVGPFANYYFFADASADNIVIVVEKTPGLYVHIGWGLSIQKAGAFTGGPYFFGSSGSYYSTYGFAGANTPGYTSSSDCPFAITDQIGSAAGFVRADVDSFTGKWLAVWNNASGPDQGYQGKVGNSSVPTTNAAPAPNTFPAIQQNGSFQFSDMSHCLVSQLDGRANLLPLMLWAQRDGTTTGYTFLGSPPFIFFTNAVGNGFTAAQDYVIGSTTYKVFPNFAVVKQ